MRTLPVIDAAICMHFVMAEFVSSRTNAEGTGFRGQEKAEFKISKLEIRNSF
jgi:hypothetical protein